MRSIRKVLPIICASITIISASNSFSCELSNLYLGLDALETRHAMQKDYGYEFFSKNPDLLNAFIGYNLPNQFFLEAGCTIGENQKRLPNLQTGNNIAPGIFYSIPADSFINIFSKNKTQFTSFGLGRSFAIEQLQYTRISLLFGFSLIKIKANYVRTGTTTFPSPTQDQINSSRITFDKHSGAPLFRLAINQQVHEDFDLRFSWTWTKSNNIQILSEQSQMINIRLKNSSAIGVGFVYYL